jgi:hypothetical protein
MTTNTANTAAPVNAAALPVWATDKQLVARRGEILTRAFGVEIETVGSTRANIAKYIAAAIPGSTVRQGSDSYKSYYVAMTDGREWRIMGDGSLTGSMHGAPRWTDKAGEVVSPILTWTDMDLLQTVVRAIRKAKATIDPSCGIHVHVDGRDLSAASVGRLTTLVSNVDDTLDAMLGIAQSRRRQWCKKLPAQRASDVAAAGAKLGSALARTSDALAAVWYGSGDAYDVSAARRAHYQHSRYHGLNLHSLFFRGTVEFRWFNGSLHAGEIKAYVALALALVGRSIHASAIKPIAAKIARFADAYYFLYHAGLGGPEFGNVRAHLAKWLTPAVTAESIEPAELPVTPRTRARRVPVTAAVPAVVTAADAVSAADDARAMVSWSTIVPEAFTAVTGA